MKVSLALSCGAAALLVIACSSRGSRRSESYQGAVYQPTASVPADYSVPPPPPLPPTSEPVPGPAGGAATVKTFATPKAAMDAVAAAAGLHDRGQTEAIFGKGATDVLWSGDDVADREAALKVKAMIEEGVAFEEQSESETVAALGKEEWPFPIPLVKAGSGWRFDLEKGKDELLSRRIGRNELETIGTLYEYVEAQKEYFAKGHDGQPAAYAQKVRSTAGKQDGLYWETPEGAEPSPLGSLVAEAQKSGYAPSEAPQPFQGYYYKILTSQGANVPGGKKSYLDGSRLMTGGFAAIAWPASYGNSGIMTFLVNQSGVVFEKDLGKDTEALASAITVYDPDKSWYPSARKPEIDEE